jgi:hypothetical protein
VGGEALMSILRTKAEGVREEVLVVAPALNSAVRHWASDEDGARAAAQQRLKRSLAQLEGYGVAARGEVGDGDPLQAIEDALRTFGADADVSDRIRRGAASGPEAAAVGVVARGA